MEWSRKIINSIMTKNKNPNYLYKVNIVLKPNPLDYDGMDQIVIKVFRENQRVLGRPTICYLENKKYCFNLDDAMKDIESQL